MTTSKYVTAAGFLLPSLEEIRQDMNDQWHTDIDPSVDVSPESPEGQVIGILASHKREVLEVAAIAYNIHPRDVEGVMLDDVAAVTGTTRRGATKSKFQGARALRATLDAGVTVPADSRVYVEDHPEIQFKTLADVTNSGGAPATFDMEAEALEDGPVAAYADTVNQIATPIAGWTAVNNPSDVELGSNAEKDPPLRQRRERELRKPGSSSVDAIATDVASIKYQGLTPVEESQGFENTTEDVDSRGMPPHSIEILFFDGNTPQLPNNVVAQTIFSSRSGGIETYGTESGLAVDREGVTRVQRFSRPEVVGFGVEIITTHDVETYAGDEEFARIVADYLKARARSEMLVRHSDVTAACYTVPGITGVQHVRLWDFLYPVFTDFQMGLRTRPLFDSSDIVHESTPG